MPECMEVLVSLSVPVTNRITKRIKLCFTVNLLNQEKKYLKPVGSLVLSSLSQKVFTVLSSLVC